jgi:uncharacterized protein YdeI (YjbR/CyaY-like superfamily)
MPARDRRIDAYIANTKDFAKPILSQIREAVHAACPDVEETLKWSAPTFMYAGSIMCGMAAFKEHCHFHFWKGQLILDQDGASVNDSMRALVKVSDLPSKRLLTSYIKQAMKLNEEGVSVPKSKSAAKRESLSVPAELAAALKRNKKAAQTFEKFSPSHRAEYIEWIAGAKREETRERRIEQAIEWLADGKPRNWKYM